MMIDFLLRVCLNMDQWLDACVAIERAMTIIQGTRFVKKRSQQIAKRIIVILIIMIVATSVHRHLIDEENQDINDIKRTWCFVCYSSSFKVYNTVINFFQFLVPFLLNLTSIVILLTKITRQQSSTQRHQNSKEIFREQLQQHRHLFTAPLVLVILSIPRLVISCISKCLKSGNDPWLYLVGYFIPSILTCAIFILPSKFYKTEFRKTILHYQSVFRRI